MINVIPVLGWFLSFLVNVSLAIPFWVCWTCFNIGRIYFDFLPDAWQSIPFWNCVGLFMSVSIIKVVFVPKFSSTEQNNMAKDQSKK